MGIHIAGEYVFIESVCFGSVLHFLIYVCATNLQPQAPRQIVKTTLCSLGGKHESINKVILYGVLLHGFMCSFERICAHLLLHNLCECVWLCDLLQCVV